MMSLALLTGYAFLGGLILNVMPCVLPVLTLKVFHTIESVGESLASRRMQGVAYALGTTSMFFLFALIIIGLRLAGHTLGWGMHFQHPPFVGSLTALIFVFGLNALGVFEVSVGSLSGGQSKTSSWLGAWSNGCIAAIMSTPCTAPFLGAAASIALSAQTPAWQTLWLFTVIGLGLATPYTLFTWSPHLSRIIPKPGAWMVTFKQLMGFSLVGTALWLFGSLQVQLTPQSAHDFLLFLGLLGFALWAVDHFTSLNQSLMRRLTTRIGIVVVVLFTSPPLLSFEKVAVKPLGLPKKMSAADTESVSKVRAWPPVTDGKINWHPFEPELVAEARQKGRIVFMDYTADWCAACKANEKLFLETDVVRNALRRTNTLPMMADMTHEQPVIEQWLGGLKRDGITVTGLPAYVMYLPDGSYDLLPVTITGYLVEKHLDANATRFPSSALFLPKKGD
jgi:thiol:disulfide interchange protein